MRAKVFTARATKDVAEQLERQFDVWLAANPEAKPVIAEKLTHPTFGLGQVVVSACYEGS